MDKILTIAGSDCSGGAGIQADLKTIAAHGMYGMSAVTAITAQNTCGVFAVEPVAPELLRAQLEAVFADLAPDAVKIGMTATAGNISVIADVLRACGARHVVFDPVMAATAGCSLLSAEGRAALELLCPAAELITPNLGEAAALCGFPVHSLPEMERAARTLSARFGTAVLVKGGHLAVDAQDVLFDGTAFAYFTAPRISNPNTHGTGCTLSSAIACNLAAGHPLVEAVRRGKAYLTGAIAAQLDLGAGRGPLDHLYRLFPPGR